MTALSWAGASVLLVSEDAPRAQPFVAALRDAGFTVTVHDEAARALELVEARPVDAVLVMSGPQMVAAAAIAWCAALRRRQLVPIVLMLGELAAEALHVEAFALGVDDCVGPACSPRETAARVGAVLRRVRWAPDFVWRRPTNFAPTRACSCGSQITSGDPLAGVVRRPVIRRAADRHPPPLSPRNRLDLRSLATQRSGAADSRGRTNSGAPVRGERTLEVGKLLLDFAMMEARFDGRSVHLTQYEFDLLKALAEQAGRVLTREELMERAKGSVEDSFDRSIDVHICRLRAKLGDVRKRQRVLKTVRGVGYLLSPE